VRLVSHESLSDPLQPGVVVTRLRWDARDALPFHFDLVALGNAFNIVPATAGERRELDFARAPLETLPESVQAAVEREGPLRIVGVSRERLLTPQEAEAERARLERPPIVFFGLSGTEVDGLGFLGEALRHTRPEIQVIQNPDTASPTVWTWRRSLIDADPTETVFTLEDGIWQRVRAFSRIGTPFVHQDYATGAGFSVRFGDGEFGMAPPPNDRFRVIYRTAPGVNANVPPGAIGALAFGDVNDFLDQPWIVSATNPLPVTNGVAPEAVAQAKQLASEAYQAETFFAVRPRDYGEQAERLEFVQRAQGTARWTGSWTSMFVAADPFGSLSLTTDQRGELEDYMNCVRQTGRDVIVRDPKTVAVDLKVGICLEPQAHANHVLAQLLEVMFGPGINRRIKGFFHPDHFTFGTPLRRSALEAAVQRVPGVLSVRNVRIRQRGLGPFRPMREVVRFGHDQILRLENDPTRPDGGSLAFLVQGGV
jgi:predicted phage baseplate assembly protein